MAEIRWTEEAHRWLRDIHDYIADDNPDAAQKVVADILKKPNCFAVSLKLGTSIASRQKVKSGCCSTDIIGLHTFYDLRPGALIYWAFFTVRSILIDIFNKRWAQLGNTEHLSL